jgi:hypothetical protein
VLKNKKDKTATTTSRKSSFNEKQRSKGLKTKKPKRFSKVIRHLGNSQAEVFFNNLRQPCAAPAKRGPSGQVFSSAPSGRARLPVSPEPRLLFPTNMLAAGAALLSMAPTEPFHGAGIVVEALAGTFMPGVFGSFAGAKEQMNNRLETYRLSHPGNVPATELLL